MIYLEPGVYVRVKESYQAPAPYPLKNNFSETRAYRVFCIFTLSESSEAYLIVSNDDDKLFFISNRHWRFVALNTDATSSYFDLPKSFFEEHYYSTH